LLPLQPHSPIEFAAARLQPPGSARQTEDQTGSGGGDAGDHAGIDRVWPAVLRQMELRVAAD